MTTTPNINKALSTTAQDFRTLGEAAKTDFNRLTHDAQELAQTKLIQPGVQMIKDTTSQIEVQARRTAEVAKVKIDHLREYIVENPGRSLIGALAGGLLLGMLMRR